MVRIAYNHVERVATIQHAIQQQADVTLAIVSQDSGYREICCVTLVMNILSGALV